MRVLASLAAMALVLPSFAHAGLSLRVTADSEAKVYLGSEYVGNTPLTLTAVKQGTHSLRLENIETGEVKSYSVSSPRIASTEKTIHAGFDQEGSSLSGAVERLRASRSYASPDRRAGSLYDPYQSSGYADGAPNPAYGYAPNASIPAPAYYGNPALAYAPQAAYCAPSYAAPVYGPPAYAAPVFASPAFYGPVGYPGRYYGSGGYYGGGGFSGRGYGRNRSANNFRNVILGAGLFNEVFNRSNRSRPAIRRGLVGAGLLNELTRGSGGGRGGRGGRGGGFLGF